MHQNKAKVRKFPGKCVLGTAVRLTIFSNIQLIKKNLAAILMDIFPKFRESTKLTSIFRKRTALFNFKQDMFRE